MARLVLLVALLGALALATALRVPFEVDGKANHEIVRHPDLRFDSHTNRSCFAGRLDRGGPC